MFALASEQRSQQMRMKQSENSLVLFRPFGFHFVGFIIQPGLLGGNGVVPQTVQKNQNVCSLSLCVRL